MFTWLFPCVKSGICWCILVVGLYQVEQWNHHLMFLDLRLSLIYLQIQLSSVSNFSIIFPPFKKFLILAFRYSPQHWNFTLGFTTVNCAPQILQVPGPVWSNGHQLGDGDYIMGCRRVWIYLVCHWFHQHPARSYHIPDLCFGAQGMGVYQETVGAQTFRSVPQMYSFSCQYPLQHPGGRCCATWHVVCYAGMLSLVM